MNETPASMQAEMDAASLAVVDVLTAISEAKRRLLQYAASIWAKGTYSYVLGGRRSAESWAYPVTGTSRSVRLLETIDLKDGRDLSISLKIGFGPGGFRLEAGIETSYEVEDGYGGDEILVLPRIGPRSATELIDKLNRYVGDLCADENLLDRLGLRGKGVSA